MVFLLFKFAIQEFLEDREYKNVADKTILGYKEVLYPFNRWLTENGYVNVENVTNGTIKKFIVDCRRKGNNATTTNSKMQRIKAFFNYLVEIQVIEESPAKGIKRAKEDIRIDVFSDYHIKQMLNYYRRLKHRDKAFFAYRDYTIIITFLSTGIRQKELIGLKWSDIDFVHQTMVIFGKSRKNEIIPITDKLVNELAGYKIFCQEFFEDKMSEYVFTNRFSKQLTPNAVQNIFKRLKEVMNFKDVRLSSHTFRHTFCQRCIQAGMSTFAVQKLMRHSSVAVTEKYAAMWGNDLKEQNDKYNPLNNLDV